MKKLLVIIVLGLLLPNLLNAEPIKHIKFYPADEIKNPLPAVILLHTSGGFNTRLIKTTPVKYTNAGYVVYVPDFLTNIKLQKRVD